MVGLECGYLVLSISNHFCLGNLLLVDNFWQVALTGTAEQVRVIGSNNIVASSFGDVSRGFVKMRTSGALQQPNPPWLNGRARP